MTMIYTVHRTEIGLLEDIKAGRIKNLEGACLEEADLRGADLRNTNLRYSYLRSANLSCASLQTSDLRYASLLAADLQGAYLFGANLVGATLHGVNLQSANLVSCIGNKKEIKSLQLDTYNIVYTHDRLQIGCKNHGIAEWFNFDDETIDDMDEGALEWWNKYKSYIKLTIELSPAIKP